MFAACKVVAREKKNARTNCDLVSEVRSQLQKFLQRRWDEFQRGETLNAEKLGKRKTERERKEARNASKHEIREDADRSVDGQLGTEDRSVVNPNLTTDRAAPCRPVN